MKNVMLLSVHGCTLSLALLGLVGCAIDENDPSRASDEVAGDESSEPFDPERAAAIAKVKMALLGAAAISPQAAACGQNGPTSTSELVNDVAFAGAVNQRTGSSTACTSRGQLQRTDDAFYFCYTLGGDGFTWTYNQSLQSGIRGWTRGDGLRPPPGATVGGARNLCVI